MKLPRHSSEYTNWDDAEHRVRRSDDPDVRGHYLSGVDRNGELFFLNEEILRNHCQVIGATGSGKTARGILPLVVQDIRRAKLHVSYLDLKGESAVPGTLSLEARWSGLPYRYFSIRSNRPTYGYFPLRQSCWRNATSAERMQFLVNAFNLITSSATPSEEYWSVIAQMRLLEVIELCPDAVTFQELYDVAKNPETRENSKLEKRDYDQAGVILPHLWRVASCPQINVGSPSVVEHAISVKEMLTTPGVTYFDLPVQIAPILAPVVARMLDGQLNTEARMMGGAVAGLSNCIDEYQDFVTPRTITSLKQSRDLKIFNKFGHQNFSDLESGPTSLLDSVVANVAVRMSFSARDSLGKKHLKEASDRVARVDRSASKTVSESGAGEYSIAAQNSVQETLEERMSADAIALLNAHDGLAVVEAYPNKGLTTLKGPTFLYMPHICSSEEYQRRKDMPWPPLTEFTMLGGVPPENEEPPPSPPTQVPPSPPSSPPTPPVALRRVRPRKPRSKRDGTRPEPSVMNDSMDSSQAVSLEQYLFSLTESEQ